MDDEQIESDRTKICKQVICRFLNSTVAQSLESCMAYLSAQALRTP